MDGRTAPGREPAAMTEPLWLSVARMTVGISEIPGAASNAVILQWGKDIGAPAFTNDDTPWCAVWFNRLMLACQIQMAGTGYELLRAKSVETWGQACPRTLGAVQVFKRPGGYHVGLYLGEKRDAYLVLGGNTGNTVAPAWIFKDRLTATRWPAPLALPSYKPVLLTDHGEPLSTNEA